MKRKDFEIFSAEELASLQMFAKNAVKEDKKLHGIMDKDTKSNKTKNITSNFYNQEKSKTVSIPNTNKPNQFQVKKEEKKPQQIQSKPLKNNEPVKNTITKPIEKKVENVRPPPKVETIKKPNLPNIKVEKPKELNEKIPENAVHKFVEKKSVENNKGGNIKIEPKKEEKKIIEPPKKEETKSISS